MAPGEFKRVLPAEFNSGSIASLTPWEPPAELPYISPVAEQFHFACHLGKIKQTVQVCEALGQYENYLVRFHTHVGPGYMTYKDIETILMAIDEIMAQHSED